MDIKRKENSLRRRGDMSFVESATACYVKASEAAFSKVSSGEITEADAAELANSICDAFKQAANEAGENDFPDKFTPLVEGRLGEDGVAAFGTFYTDVNLFLMSLFETGKIGSPQEAGDIANAIADKFKMSANEAGADDFPAIFSEKIQEYL
jgi:hypothetical protein